MPMYMMCIDTYAQAQWSYTLVTSKLPSQGRMGARQCNSQAYDSAQGKKKKPCIQTESEIDESSYLTHTQMQWGTVYYPHILRKR